MERIYAKYLAQGPMVAAITVIMNVSTPVPIPKRMDGRVLR